MTRVTMKHQTLDPLNLRSLPQVDGVGPQVEMPSTPWAIHQINGPWHAKMYRGHIGTSKLRSAYASAQSDQGPRYLQIELLDNKECLKAEEY